MKQDVFCISHFLDDFPLLHRECNSSLWFMNEFYRLMDEIDMPVTVCKTLGPTLVLKFLGLTLNFLLQLITIPEKKRKKCVDHIKNLSAAHCHKWKVTMKQIQQVAGSLNFICQLAGFSFHVCTDLWEVTLVARWKQDITTDWTLRLQWIWRCSNSFSMSVLKHLKNQFLIYTD